MSLDDTWTTERVPLHPTDWFLQEDSGTEFFEQQVQVSACEDNSDNQDHNSDVIVLKVKEFVSKVQENLPAESQLR
jgi:hypothetical protein